MKLQVLYGLLMMVLVVGGSGGTLESVLDAVKAVACGCGCKFENVGTCESRLTTQCKSKRAKKCVDIPTPTCKKVPTSQCKTIYHDKCDYGNKCDTTYKRQCLKVPSKHCKQVTDEKCHQIPKKSCQTVYENKCKKIPNKVCRTVYKKNCNKVPQKECKSVQKCKTTYEKTCKPTYAYREYCQSTPKQNCWNEDKCREVWVDKCTNVPKQKCETKFTKKCDNVPKEECKITIEQKCEKIPNQLCTTTYKEECKNVPKQNCKKTKNCVKVPERKCWKDEEINCRNYAKKSCFFVPTVKCWKVNIKKNRYVKRKQCQECRKHRETIYVKGTKQRCNKVPRKECRTLYMNECQKVPQQDCKTVYTDKCDYEKECKTTYELKCSKPKPSYNAAPSYGAPQEQCERVPMEKCWNQRKCKKVPSQQCSTQYKNSCKKVPKEKCTTKIENKCEKYSVDIPQQKTKSTCHWPAPQRDRFCTRRSDTDVFLDDKSDYSEDLEYLGKEVDDEIDFLNVFPLDYTGNPNDTKTGNGPVQPGTAAPNFNLDAEPPLHAYPDVGNEDYTFPNNYNTSGVLREVKAPGTPTPDPYAGRLYHSLDVPAARPYSAPYPSNQQAQAPPQQVAYSADSKPRVQSASDDSNFGFNSAVESQSIAQGFFPDNMADIFKTQIGNGFADSPTQNLWKRRGSVSRASSEPEARASVEPPRRTGNLKHKSGAGRPASRTHPQLSPRTFAVERAEDVARPAPQQEEDAAINGFDGLTDFWPQWGSKLN